MSNTWYFIISEQHQFQVRVGSETGEILIEAPEQQFWWVTFNLDGTLLLTQYGNYPAQSTKVKFNNPNYLPVTIDVKDGNKSFYVENSTTCGFGWGGREGEEIPIPWKSSGGSMRVTCTYSQVPPVVFVGDQIGQSIINRYGKLLEYGPTGEEQSLQSYNIAITLTEGGPVITATEGTGNDDVSYITSFSNPYNVRFNLYIGTEISLPCLSASTNWNLSTPYPFTGQMIFLLYKEPCERCGGNCNSPVGCGPGQTCVLGTNNQYLCAGSCKDEDCLPGEACQVGSNGLRECLPINNPPGCTGQCGGDCWGTCLGGFRCVQGSDRLWSCEAECTGICGGTCTGTCPSGQECAIVSGEYTCLDIIVDPCTKCLEGQYCIENSNGDYVCSVPTPWYKTWWFITIMVIVALIVLGILGYFGYKYLTKKPGSPPKSIAKSPVTEEIKPV